MLIFVDDHQYCDDDDSFPFLLSCLSQRMSEFGEQRFDGGKMSVGPKEGSETVDK